MISQTGPFLFGFSNDLRNFLWQTYDQNYEEHVNVNI